MKSSSSPSAATTTVAFRTSRIKNSPSLPAATALRMGPPDDGALPPPRMVLGNVLALLLPVALAGLKGGGQCIEGGSVISLTWQHARRVAGGAENSILKWRARHKSSPNPPAPPATHLTFAMLISALSGCSLGMVMTSLPLALERCAVDASGST